eukprot:261139_1
MTANPFTAKNIEKRFNISAEQLPKFFASEPQIQTELQRQECVAMLIQNRKCFENIINKTKWQKRAKINIYNKRNNTNRKTLSFSKPEFVNKLKQAYDYSSRVIPIVMPDASSGDNSHHIEFVQIMRIQSGCDIGLSYRYDEIKNKILPCGIHLDGEFIRSQHQLLVPNDECVILDSFISNIDYLTIGNPDYFENVMHRYKNKSEKLASFLTNSREYFSRMMSNAANITDDNIKIWIDKARNALSNDKHVNYFLDASMLLESNKIVTTSQIIFQNLKLYVNNLRAINNFYYQQTLSPYPQPIMAHPIHKYKHQPSIIPHIMIT